MPKKKAVKKDVFYSGKGNYEVVAPTRKGVAKKVDKADSIPGVIMHTPKSIRFRTLRIR